MMLSTRKDMGSKRNNIKDRGVNRGEEEKNSAVTLAGYGVTRFFL